MSVESQLLPAILMYSVFALILLYRVKRSPELIKIRSNRYISYILVVVLGTLFFGNLSTLWKSNQVFFLASVCTELAAYFELGWARLNLVPTSYPSRLSASSPRREWPLIIHPLAAFGLGVTCLLELLAFLLAGPTDFAQLFMPNITLAARNIWLWLAAIITLLYVSACQLAFLLEMIKGIAVRKEGATPLRLRYRCASFAVIGVLQLFYFTCQLTAVIFIRPVSLTPGSHVDLQARYDLVLNWLISFNLLALTALVFFDKRFFALYQWFHRQRTHQKLAELRWFYERVLKLFPASHRFNLYRLMGDSSAELVLDGVVNGLNDVRSLLWQVEAWQQAEQAGVEVEELKPARPASLKTETRLWLRYLNDPSETLVATQYARRLSPPNAVPPLIARTTESLATYYVQLARQIKPCLQIALSANEKNWKREDVIRD